MLLTPRRALGAALLSALLVAAPLAQTKVLAKVNGVEITDEDWRNREKNREYERAAEEMFEKTHHKLAPWDVIAGEQKRYARVKCIETLIKRVEEGMVRWGIEIPHMDAAIPKL